jgi:hypothetical protein
MFSMVVAEEFSRYFGCLCYDYFQKSTPELYLCTWNVILIAVAYGKSSGTK